MLAFETDCCDGSLFLPQTVTNEEKCRWVFSSLPSSAVFLWRNPSGRTVALGSTQPLTEMSTRKISLGIKAVGSQGWQSYHLHVATVLKSGNLNPLEPSGPVQACNGIALEASWNVMAHAQKPDFVFRRNGRVHLNRRGRQFSRLLAAEVCASAVVMLGTSCSEVVWRVLATHSIHQFPLHFPSRASPCAITFQLESTFYRPMQM